jgi:hypothetical protein
VSATLTLLAVSSSAYLAPDASAQERPNQSPPEHPSGDLDDEDAYANVKGDEPFPGCLLSACCCSLSPICPLACCVAPSLFPKSRETKIEALRKQRAKLRAAELERQQELAEQKQPWWPICNEIAEIAVKCYDAAKNKQCDDAFVAVRAGLIGSDAPDYQRRLVETGCVDACTLAKAGVAQSVARKKLYTECRGQLLKSFGFSSDPAHPNPGTPQVDPHSELN